MQPRGVQRWNEPSTPAALLVLSLLTLGEIRLLDRLLFSTPAEYNFVLQNIAGILAGTPVWKAFQNRLLGSAAVVALDALTGDRLTSFRVFIDLTTAAANLLLFHVTRRRSGLNLDGLLAVVGFGLARVLLTFRLECPWDDLDILLFLAFGAWAARRGSLLGFSLLLLAGTLNRETVLYIPLWYLLAPLDTPRSSPGLARQVLLAAAFTIVMGAVIVSVRDHLYRGQPNLPGQVFEATTPVISNPIHLAHNVLMLVRDDWKAITRAFISASLLVVTGLLIFNLTRGRSVRASAWSLCVIGSVFVFGYINETRLYFPLISFWFAYASPAGARARERDERVSS